ncbi:YgdI/YgdR family lipoprotein [Bacillus cereus]|nr:YgdI/YgdR family lipoprotein [Bacillus cereus]
MKKILIIGALCLSLTSLTACSNNTIIYMHFAPHFVL